MGTYITLEIGELEIDWGKNAAFRDHSALFRPSDAKKISISRYDEQGTESGEVYSRKLRNIRRRLDLLSYDINSLERMYIDSVRNYTDFGYSITLPFDVFFDAAKTVDVSKPDIGRMENREYPDRRKFCAYVTTCLLEQEEVRDRQWASRLDEDVDSFTPEQAIADFLEGFDPYIFLRIIAENPNNLDLEVFWYFDEVVNSGYVRRNQVVKELSQEKRILIVTEGTSDSLVLKKTINALYADISDFFEFIDVSEKFPFTGTGNLYNFCLAMCQIKIQNNLIVLFDNDTAGVDKFLKTMALDKPETFVVMRLPDHPTFSNFETIGPQGVSSADINGKAVAIECFLDFQSVSIRPCVRWWSYEKGQQQYQGKMEAKEHYVEAFKTCNLIDGSYDVSKLIHLVDYIIQCWVNRERKG